MKLDIERLVIKSHNSVVGVSLTRLIEQTSLFESVREGFSLLQSRKLTALDVTSAVISVSDADSVVQLPNPDAILDVENACALAATQGDFGQEISNLIRSHEDEIDKLIILHRIGAIRATPLTPRAAVPKAAWSSSPIVASNNEDEAEKMLAEMLAFESPPHEEEDPKVVPRDVASEYSEAEMYSVTRVSYNQRLLAHLRLEFKFLVMLRDGMFSDRNQNKALFLSLYECITRHQGTQEHGQATDAAQLGLQFEVLSFMIQECLLTQEEGSRFSWSLYERISGCQLERFEAPSIPPTENSPSLNVCLMPGSGTDPRDSTFSSKKDLKAIAKVTTSVQTPLSERPMVPARSGPYSMRKFEDEVIKSYTVPGEKVTVSDLSARLGVSKGTIGKAVSEVSESLGFDIRKEDQYCVPYYNYGVGNRLSKRNVERYRLCEDGVVEVIRALLNNGKLGLTYDP